jgi:hypothetical protein
MTKHACPQSIYLILLVRIRDDIRNAYEAPSTVSIKYRMKELSLILNLIIFIATSIILAVIALDISSSAGEDVFSSPSNLTPVDGIRCDSMEFTKFHIHAHLDIFVDGKPFTVPSQIGIDPEGRCLYWLHTHDDSGIIHIESPVEREFSIGNFIDIWDQTPNNAKLFDNDVNATNSVLGVYVNGIEVPTGTDIRNISINAHDEIALIIGPIQDDKIPSHYQFQQGL